MTTDPEPQPELRPTVTTDAWQATLERLRLRFPDARDGILFCVHKLEQNPHARLTDFRDEAALYGVPLSGRSLNSAKVLLGLAEKPTRKPKQRLEDEPAAPPRVVITPRRTSGPSAADNLETQLTSALQQIQRAATEQSQRLRDAIQQAIDVLQQALDHGQ